MAFPTTGLIADSTTHEIGSMTYVYNGVGWDVVTASTSFATFTELQTAVGGETVITVPTYTVGANQLVVAIEGNVQYLGTDYTETNSTTITLTTALTADEKILIQKV